MSTECTEYYTTALLLSSLLILSFTTADSQERSRQWLSKVRIGAYSLTADNAEKIVREAHDSGVYGIEVDNDIPGRYESLLEPSSKLDALRHVAAAAHADGNKVFVYIAGLECISTQAEGNHTLAKEHPDWLQRKQSGEPAIFDTKAAFWIRKGEEDAWVSPYAADWRRLYMQRVRQIAATGVDGIYVDIPYWMTHFTGWEDSWASFDDNTVEAFRKRTGINARKDIKLNDPEDKGFREWVTFRIQTITDFVAEIRENAVSANAGISVIPEIFPGIEESAPRVGADVYKLYTVADAISHEYEFGDGDDHTAASRSPLDWLQYQVGIRSFRAFAGDKPTWILNYSWDGAPHVQPREAMLNLAMSELMAGANLWDARGHVMSGSNDMATRKEIFTWVGAHEDIFGAERHPLGEVGVYFSDSTRNLYPHDFVDSYRGILLLLLQSHVQFRIVTPRTLSRFSGRVLALPSVRTVDHDELISLQRFSKHGGQLVFTGTGAPELDSIKKALRFPGAPERQYLTSLQRNFEHPDTSAIAALLTALKGDSSAEIQASPVVVAHAAMIGNCKYLFLANFDGLKAGEVAVAHPQHNVVITLEAAPTMRLHVLPFLGNESSISGVPAGSGRVLYVIPELNRGAVAWLH